MSKGEKGTVIKDSNIAGNTFKNSGTITINGHKVNIPNGKSISFNNGKILVDGKDVGTEIIKDEKIIHVVVDGNIESIDAVNIETITANQIGSVDCHNVNVTGDIVGDIDCHNITVSGNVTGEIDGHNVTVAGKRL